MEVEGPGAALAEFELRLTEEKPPAAVVLAKEVSRLAPAGHIGFVIRESGQTEAPTAAVLPDLATCPHCQAELFDAADRRHGYPFINCTLCGPRYSIVRDIPYDRPNTTMAGFALCPECRREYEDPGDRRFHAQPNACPVCGPRLEWHAAGGDGADSQPAVVAAAEALAEGRIVAVKGVGGFQLLVDARNEDAVARLRERKQREEKPFALMVPDLEAARRWCRVSAAEAALLASPAAPIVLLEPSGEPGLAAGVARSSPFLGIMLPYSPLHHLLLRGFPHPVVATSGNRSDEPIATDDDEAAARLGGIADAFLGHDRPIARPCDDSVARISRGAPVLIRRARGYAPLPVRVPRDLPPMLAVGGHLKNSVAIAMGRQVIVSQHVGDLDTLEARRGFERAIEDLCRLYRFTPEAIACDLHPDYASTRWAHAAGLPVIPVQHHHAHVAACAAENDVTEPYLGIAWDGTGYGLDGTIWGGEAFLVEGGRMERFAHLRPFRLPGGQAAVREAWRSAAAVRYEIGLPLDESPEVVRRMLERKVNCPVTTSVGRLFDAVAAMSGLVRENRFEGQAAMTLERAIGPRRGAEAYALPGGDWEPLIRAVAGDVARGTGADEIALKLHNALAEWIVDMARACGRKVIILSGGVFQNRYLTERAAALLEEHGFQAVTHQRVPANDGGIALGQAVLAGVAAGNSAPVS